MWKIITATMVTARTYYTSKDAVTDVQEVELFLFAVLKWMDTYKLVTSVFLHRSAI